jgi:class 3 adenylate cyclase/tetratricopeptide (TPR) repeat protein
MNNPAAAPAPETKPTYSGWTLDDFQSRGKQANSDGDALLAYDVADAGLKLWPSDAVLRQIKALALARMGSTSAAHEILSALGAEAADEETLGLFARTYKDVWLATGNAADLETAREAYLRAYRSSPERYWTGINAATLSYLAGDLQESRRLAREILVTCQEALPSASGSAQYWLSATAAEAHLLLGHSEEAEEWYRKAGALAGNRLGDIASTWNNAQLILTLMPPELHEVVERALDVPAVAVFAGHRVDEPDRAQPRLPETRAAWVKQEILDCLREKRARIGYSSAAAGADILFLEAIQELGGRTEVVLPCDPAQFLRESVAKAGDDWVRRYEAVLDNAANVTLASRERLTLGSVAYDFSNELLYGLATLRARQFGTKLFHVAVWDGRPGDGPGGTADIVRRWRERSREVTVIRPLGALMPGYVPARPAPLETDDGAPGVRAEIRAMLFADAFHFSRLAEADMVPFIRHFLGPIAMLIRQTKPAPLFQNTWGDGLYLVFSDVREAGVFALKLAGRAGSIDRARWNLPAGLDLRIALHAGPVYCYKDQIIDRLNYIGSHVNRAARIEPVTPPGQVYVTDAFAALAEVQVPGQFRFDYVGKVPLAKSFGEYPVYRMRAAE